MAAENQVVLDIPFQKQIGSILFGGEGFILQKLYGEGTAWIYSAGDIIEFTLVPGQMLKVATGNVVAWEGSVNYDIGTVGGVRTAIFGGEGLFVTTLTGPGKVLLQSMTMQKLVGSIIPLLPKPRSGSAGHHVAAPAPAAHHGGFHVTIGGGHH